jgi:hypothetical protein
LCINGLLHLDASLLHLREMLLGAGRGNRTPTVSLPPDFESGASTSSAIPAERRIIAQTVIRYNMETVRREHCECKEETDRWFSGDDAGFGLLFVSRD